MNKYFRMLLEVPTGFLKLCFIKLLHFKSASVSFVSAISPLAEITVDKNSSIEIKEKFRLRSGAHIRVRKNSMLKIGRNVSVNHNCMIVCHEKIVIGDDVQFSPNVYIYDHDHDYKAAGGVKSMKYKSSPVLIGNNVWIGANTVILRGSKIGDNVVIAAGSIVNGEIASDSLFVQKRESTIINRQDK